MIFWSCNLGLKGKTMAVSNTKQKGDAIALGTFFDQVFDASGLIHEPTGCDTAHYLKKLDEFEMSKEDKTELIHTLWHVLDSIQRLQLGIHPLTDIMNEKAALRASHSVAMVNSCPIATKTDKGDTS